MFGNHTAQYIAHLEEEVKVLRSQVAQYQDLLSGKEQAFARERQELLNRLVGLPPQQGASGEPSPAYESVPYRSRISLMLEDQRKRMEDAYFASQRGATAEDFEEFRAQVKAEAAEASEATE